MKFITTFMGIITALGGIYLITKEGVLFTQIAFPLGLLFLIIGIIECISYKSYRGDQEEKAWVLIDGSTTFVLGFITIMNQITLDSIASSVLGLWVIIIGIRNFVRAIEHYKKDEKQAISSRFYNHLIIGLLNFCVGLIVFLNAALLNLPTMLLVGLCVVVEGINVINVGMSIILRKIPFIQTKQERIVEIENRTKKAYMLALKNLRDVEKSKEELTIVKETPEEFLDLTLVNKPTVDEDRDIEKAKKKELRAQKRKAAQLKRQKDKERLEYEKNQEKLALLKQQELEQKSAKEVARRAIEESYRKSEALRKVEDEREREANKRAYALKKEQDKIEAKNRKLEEKALAKEKKELEALEKQKEKEALERQKLIEIGDAERLKKKELEEAEKKRIEEEQLKQKRLEEERIKEEERQKKIALKKARDDEELELRKKSLIANEFEVSSGNGVNQNLGFAVLESQKETEYISDVQEFDVTPKK